MGKITDQNSGGTRKYSHRNLLRYESVHFLKFFCLTSINLIMFFVISNFFDATVFTWQRLWYHIKNIIFDIIWNEYGKLWSFLVLITYWVVWYFALSYYLLYCANCIYWYILKLFELWYWVHNKYSLIILKLRFVLMRWWILKSENFQYIIIIN